MLFRISSHQPIIPNYTVIGAVTYYRDMYPLVAYSCTFNCHGQFSNTIQQTVTRLSSNEGFFGMNLSLPLIFLSIFPLQLVIINLDWLSSTGSLLPLILSSSLSLANIYHHGKRTSFIVETLTKFHTMLFGCHELTNATFLSILLLPIGSSAGTSLLEEYQVHFHHIQGSSNTHSQLSYRLLAHEGWTMDSIFDPLAGNSVWNSIFPVVSIPFPVLGSGNHSCDGKQIICHTIRFFRPLSESFRSTRAYATAICHMWSTKYKVRTRTRHEQGMNNKEQIAI